VTDSNGHTYEVCGKWYHVDDLMASVVQASILTDEDHVINPPESSREYSSIFADDGRGMGHARSMLDSPQAWSAKVNEAGEWMKIDLGYVATVTGVATEGRSGVDQYVAKFNIQCSCNGSDWIHVSEDFCVGPRKFRVSFAHEVSARFVKIIVREWHGHISMRAGVLVEAEKIWSMCDGVDCFPDQCEEQMVASDLDAVKQYASSKGYQAFVILKGIAYFKRQKTQECQQAFKTVCGATTYTLMKAMI